MDITDYLEIQNLLGQYGHLIDDHDWDAFGALFTPDATLDYTAVRAPRVLHGVGEILDHFRSANHPSAHRPGSTRRLPPVNTVPPSRRARSM